MWLSGDPEKSPPLAEARHTICHKLSCLPISIRFLTNTREEFQARLKTTIMLGKGAVFLWPIS
jgi:hypothetical protein